MKKVLVTGGAGFIGNHYVYAHLERFPEDQIVVLDALTYAGHREFLKEAEEKGVRFVLGRIEDRALVYELFEKEKFDLVVHFAAETHVDRSIVDPSPFTISNVLGTQVLLDAARDFSVSRFHHISTDEVYGDLSFESTDSFSEGSLLKPSNPYSASKAASDHLCLAYFRTFGLPVSISRCSNNYGPQQSLDKFIPVVIQKAIQNEAIPVYGEGKNVRDWLFVRDHCEAVLEIVEKGLVGEIYNIGGVEEQKNIDVALWVLKLLGKPESLIQFVEDRKGHDQRYSISFDKIQKEIGWSPKTSFEEGMRSTVEWYTLKPYERSYTRWWNGFKARSPHQSHEQAPAAGLR